MTRRFDGRARRSVGEGYPWLTAAAMTRRRCRPPVGRALGAALIALGGACGEAHGPPTIPDTFAGRAFAAWLDAYNAADSARLDAYARRYEPMMSVHTQMVFRQQTGRYDIASVERSGPQHLEIMLRTRPDSTAARTPLTVYVTLDMADSATGGATTTLALLDKGSPTSVFAALAKGQGTSLTRIGGAPRGVAVESLAAKVARNYVRMDVGLRVADSLRARRSRGAYDDYDTEVGLAQRLNADLLELAHDEQLGVEYARRVPAPPPTPTPPATMHCGLEPAKWLDPGVAYVNFYGFGDPDPTCGHEVSDVMNAVAGARALVVDVRENRDESRADMAYLASYLVAGCTHLDDSWNRRTGRTEALWTHDGLPGPAFAGTKPLVILTSARTFAAAEELAYDLQKLGRATVVGERTGGGAYTAAFGQIGEHLLVRVPVARVVNPITRTSWQGAGVTPDILAPASDALATARRMIREGRVARAARALPVASAAADPIPPGGGAALGGTPGPRRGIQFTIDTVGRSDASWGGLLSRVAGMLVFADGRGRLDVTAIRRARAVSLGGVTVAEPLARPGDYYLFDNAGFILVRPPERSFSRFMFTRADFNQTGALLPGAYLMWPAAIRADTLPNGDRAARRQHAPVTVHWHMQPPASSGRADKLYARGWLEIVDAPAVEAGVARWFEVAAALATRPGGISALARDGVEVTSVALFRQPNERRHSVTYLEMLTPRRLATIDVDPVTLLLPAGYTETPWPGFARQPRSPHSAPTSAERWRTLEDTASQRVSALCRQAWLPEVP